MPILQGSICIPVLAILRSYGVSVSITGFQRASPLVGWQGQSPPPSAEPTNYAVVKVGYNSGNYKTKLLIFNTPRLKFQFYRIAYISAYIFQAKFFHPQVNVLKKAH